MIDRKSPKTLKTPKIIQIRFLKQNSKNKTNPKRTSTMNLTNLQKNLKLKISRLKTTKVIKSLKILKITIFSTSMIRISQKWTTIRDKLIKRRRIRILCTRFLIKNRISLRVSWSRKIVRISREMLRMLVKVNRKMISKILIPMTDREIARKPPRKASCKTDKETFNKRNTETSKLKRTPRKS